MMKFECGVRNTGKEAASCPTSLSLPLFRRLRPFVLFAFANRLQFDIETKAAHFLDEHVEALRNTSLEGVVTLTIAS